MENHRLMALFGPVSLPGKRAKDNRVLKPLGFVDRDEIHRVLVALKTELMLFRPEGFGVPLF
jgi:hypothetical protein